MTQFVSDVAFSPVVKRLQTIPGVGILTASALAASVTDPHQFTSGRQFAAWLGLTPRANSSGDKARPEMARAAGLNADQTGIELAEKWYHLAAP